MKILTLDLESYFDDQCTLKKLTYMTYVRHPSFELFGASVKINDQPTKWYGSNQLKQALDQELQEPTLIVGHNLQFDAGILSELGIFTPQEHTQYFCTKGAATALFGQSLAEYTLDALAKLFLKDTKHQGVLNFIKGRHWYELTQSEQQKVIDYCIHDVDLTHKLYQIFAPALPKEEHITLHHTIRMYAEPHMVINKPLLEQTIIDSERNREVLLVKAANILQITTEKTLKILSSNKQFPEILKQYTPIPTKPSPTTGKQIPALAKNDLEMQALCNSSIYEVRTLCEARLNAKSNILRTRAERMLEDYSRNVRAYLNYCGAKATLRDCLVGDTHITVYRYNEIQVIQLQDLKITDLVWDGEDFVEHEGLLFKGLKEVITHDSITGTGTHNVFAEKNTKISLAEAASTKTTLKSDRSTAKQRAEATKRISGR